eukprot:1161133-Pelagomonas_calceolata.AAC.5
MSIRVKLCAHAPPNVLLSVNRSAGAKHSPCSAHNLELKTQCSMKQREQGPPVPKKRFYKRSGNQPGKSGRPCCQGRSAFALAFALACGGILGSLHERTRDQEHT